jgi:hypothetical protein
VYLSWIQDESIGSGTTGSGGYDVIQGHSYGLVNFHEAEAHEELGKFGNAVEAAEVFMTRFP